MSVVSRSRGRFDALGWHNIGWSLDNWLYSLIIPIIVLVIIIIAVLVITRWRTITKSNTERKKQVEDRLLSAVSRYELSARETAYLEVLRGYARDHDMITIIEKSEIWEQCVDAAISASSGRSDEEAEEIAETITSIRKKIGFSVYPIDKQLFSTRAISTGQKCMIYSASSSKEPLIKGAVVSVNNERFIQIRYKPDAAKKFSLDTGTPLRMVFSRSDDGFYGAQVSVIGRPMRDTLEFAHTLNIKRSQLRRFVRVSAHVPIRCRMITPFNQKEPSIPTGQQFEARMNDLSGGGISFAHTQKLHSNDIVSLSFNLDSTRISGLVGTVLRISEKTVKGNKQFVHHIKFNQTSTGVQEKIVRFTFERMRMLSSWNIKRYK